MNTVEFEKVEALFAAALRRPPAEREAFLRDGIADLELRREVVALLARDERPHGVFEMDAADLAARVVGTGEVAGGAVPQRIGPYRILGVLGSGGMGVVYRAEQENPRRAVAVKVIRPGYVTPQVLHRFAQEAQVLGRLQHPGIAQIFEAGTANVGAGRDGVQPYFAMELVEGRPLLEHAAAAKLGPRERVALMTRICDAVQHAHANDIVHRDLKPANILVQSAGADETDHAASDVREGDRPRILDFGVARAIGSDVTTTTVRTDVGQLVGTLPYMSPEQIAGDSARIDARCDVYALGVILYELLTGRLPYDVLDKSLPEAARIICDVEPRPASRVDRRLRGDIDTITAKALEKDPSKRYGSAAALADDLRRHLAEEPIVARPATTLYQLRKFARRNRALVAGVAAVIFVLIVGLAVSTGLYLRSEERAEGMRRALYAHRVALASKAIDIHDAPAAARLLESCPEDLRHWEWWRQAYRADRSVRTIEAHAGHVGAIAFLPDGRLVTAGAYDYITPPEDREGALRIWDPTQGRMLTERSGHDESVTAVAVSPDGRLIATSAKAAIPNVVLEVGVRLRDADTGAIVREWAATGTGVSDVAFMPDGRSLVVADAIHHVAVLDIASGTSRRQDAWHEFGVQRVAVTPDGSRIVSVGWEGSLIVTDAETGAKLLEQRPHGTDAIIALAVHPVESVVATGGYDHAVHLLDWRTGEAIGPPLAHGESVTALAFAPDGRLITGTRLGAIRIWDDLAAPSGRVLLGHQAAVLGLAVSPDGASIASASADGTAKLWRLDAPADVLATSPHGSEVNDLAWSPDGSRIATAGDDGSICISEAATGAVQARLDHGGNPVYALAWSDDGARLVSGDHRGTLCVWNVQTGERIRSWHGHDGAIDKVCFLEGRALVVSRGRDARIAVWDAVAGVLRFDEACGTEAFGAIGVERTEGGTERIVYSDQQNALVACGDSGSPRETLLAPWSRQISVLGIHQTRRLLALGDAAGTVRIVDLKRRRLVHELAAHQRECTGVDFSPDGRRLVTAGLDRRVRVFDVETGDHMMTLAGPQSGLHCVAFSPDGRSIAAGGQDNTLRLWRTGDPTSRRERAPAR